MSWTRSYKLTKQDGTVITFKTRVNKLSDSIYRDIFPKSHIVEDGDKLDWIDEWVMSGD